MTVFVLLPVNKGLTTTLRIKSHKFLLARAHQTWIKKNNGHLKAVLLVYMYSSVYTYYIYMCVYCLYIYILFIYKYIYCLYMYSMYIVYIIYILCSVYICKFHNIYIHKQCIYIHKQCIYI